jgi:hypothetical protein
VFQDLDGRSLSSPKFHAHLREEIRRKNTTQHPLRACRNENITDNRFSVRGNRFPRFVTLYEPHCLFLFSSFFDGDFLQGRLYRSKYLWIATGAVLPHIPSIPGVEKAWRYSNFPFEKEHWKNKRLLILGELLSFLWTLDSHA